MTRPWRARLPAAVAAALSAASAAGALPQGGGGGVAERQAQQLLVTADGGFTVASQGSQLVRPGGDGGSDSFLQTRQPVLRSRAATAGPAAVQVAADASAPVQATAGLTQQEADMQREMLEELDKACCHEQIADCLACRSMTSPQAYCQQHPKTPGCDEVRSGAFSVELQAPDTDYRADVVAFVQGLEGGDLPCTFKRMSFQQANATWAALLREALAGAPPGSDAFDPTPWMRGRPYPNEGSPVDRARRRFAAELFGGEPGLVDGVAEDWPASRLWQQPHGLESRLGGKPIGLTTFAYPEYLISADVLPAEGNPPPRESLGDYLRRNDSSRDYFFFVNEPEMPQEDLRGAVEALRADFQPQPPFSASAEEQHAILAIDGAGSSHGLHRHGAVWQTQVVGRKAWWLLRPSVPTAPSRVPRVEGRDYSYPNGCEMLQRSPPPPGALTCVVGPGETLVMPQLYWHATCALDPLTAAVGGWLEDHRGRLKRQGL